MVSNSCIQHADQPMVIIRQDYRELCADAPDPNCAAAILNHFEYWTDWKIRKGLKTLWIFRSQTELKTNLFDMFSRNKIRDALVYLEATRHFLKSRHNPDKKWDRTLQYFFDADAVQAALSPIGQCIIPHRTIEYPVQDVPLSRPEQAIPENTTENTKEINNKEALPSDIPKTVYELYGDRVEELTQYSAERIKDFVTDYGVEMVREALRRMITVDPDKRKASYFGAILNNIRKEHEQELHEVKRAKEHQDQYLTNAQEKYKDLHVTGGVA